MSAYAWLIDKSEIDDGEIRLVGPSDAPGDLVADLWLGRGKPFRIYDDDGVLYYSGRIVGDFDGFEPLDNFGTPNAGATEIHYKDPNGKWRIL